MNEDDSLLGYCMKFDTQMMEAVCTSEMSVYETALHNIPEGCCLHTSCDENLKYYITNIVLGG
jgi:hypothetical protein